MKSHTKDVSLKLGISVLPMMLLAPAVRAVEPTPWDAMKGSFPGAITVTTKTGKKLRRAGTAFFTASALLFDGTQISVPRQDVKEVVIRSRATSVVSPLR